MAEQLWLAHGNRYLLPRTFVTRTHLMCGIAGVYSKSIKLHCDEAPLYRMQRILGHRGPNDQGIDLLPELGVGLVHTRLSVIDLTPAGHQPMWNDDRTIGIIFNGEIYNFPELRLELEAQGAVFHSQTDTEVILRGYEAWGRAVVEHLNGMYAFAVWDERQNSLWLVRDRRKGKKPLYYWYDATQTDVAVCLGNQGALGVALYSPGSGSRGVAMLSGVWLCPGAAYDVRPHKKTARRALAPLRLSRSGSSTLLGSDQLRDL